MINSIHTESIKQYKEQLNDIGYIRIDDFFSQNISEELRSNLENLSHWSLTTLLDGRPFIVGHDELSKISIDERNAFFQRVANRARMGQFQYLYDFYRIIGPDSDSPLGHKRSIEIVGSKEFKGFLASLVDESLNNVSIDSQYTRYQAGYFLTSHTDEDNRNTTRLLAYVIGLTKHWRPDYGGLLNIEKDGEIAQSLIPKYNSLYIMKVPIDHHVSQVATYCNKSRLSITGWLLK